MASSRDYEAILMHRKECLSYLKNYKNVLEIGDTKGLLIVYEINNGIVGSARLDVLNNSGIITRVVTDPKHRNSGVGKSLVEYLINESKNMKLHNLTLRCLATNCQFYEKLGFKIDGDSYLEGDNRYYNMQMQIRSLQYKGSII